MHLKYDVTTVDISTGVKVQGVQSPDANSESHKSVTGKTVAVYETGPRTKQYQLQCGVTASKSAERPAWRMAHSRTASETSGVDGE